MTKPAKRLAVESISSGVSLGSNGCSASRITAQASRYLDRTPDPTGRGLDESCRRGACQKGRFRYLPVGEPIFDRGSRLKTTSSPALVLSTGLRVARHPSELAGDGRRWIEERIDVVLRVGECAARPDGKNDGRRNIVLALVRSSVQGPGTRQEKRKTFEGWPTPRRGDGFALGHSRSKQ